MDDKQRNVIAMFKTVRTYMNDNAAVWNALPAAVTAVNDLSVVAWGHISAFNISAARCWILISFLSVAARLRQRMVATLTVA